LPRAFLDLPERRRGGVTGAGVISLIGEWDVSVLPVVVDSGLVVESYRGRLAVEHVGVESADADAEGDASEASIPCIRLLAAA
jgi:hypothetical protein